MDNLINASEKACERMSCSFQWTSHSAQSRELVQVLPRLKELTGKEANVCAHKKCFAEQGKK